MAVDLNYGIGVEGKNLVLKTLGRVYVKVKDRKYELVFRPEDYRELFSEMNSTNDVDSSVTSKVILLNSISEFSSIDYPGDNSLIITKNGQFYFTENNSYVQIQPQFSVDNLSVNTITVGNQIIFTGTQAPFVINNDTLINKLNADLLDGRHGTEYTIKNQTESITGKWNFTNQVSFSNATISNILSSEVNNKIYIDFNSGYIKCNKLVTTSTDENLDIVNGIGTEVWLNYEIHCFATKTGLETTGTSFFPIEAAYKTKELANIDNSGKTINITFWYDLLFAQYDYAASTYTLRDFDSSSVIAEANKKLKIIDKTILDYQNLIDAFKKIDTSRFPDSIKKLTISRNIPILALLPNMLIKTSSGNVGLVIDRNYDNVTIKFQSLNEVSVEKIVIIGSVYNSSIVMQAKTGSLSIVKDPLDINNPALLIGKMNGITSDIFPTISGLGIYLNGETTKTPVTDLDLVHLKNYQGQSGIYLKNANLRWTDSSIFNDDGSGMIGNSLIQWLPNKLNINNPNINCGPFTLNEDGSGNIGTALIWDQNGNVSGIQKTPNFFKKTLTTVAIEDCSSADYCDFIIDTTEQTCVILSPGTFFKIQLDSSYNTSTTFQIQRAGSTFKIKRTVDPKTVYFYYYGYNAQDKSETSAIEIWKTNQS